METKGSRRKETRCSSDKKYQKNLLVLYEQHISDKTVLEMVGTIKVGGPHLSDVSLVRRLNCPTKIKKSYLVLSLLQFFSDDSLGRQKQLFAIRKTIELIMKTKKILLFTFSATISAIPTNFLLHYKFYFTTSRINQ